MDGFAVRAAETPGELPVAFRVAAGGAPPGALPPGAAAGIATGGTVPDGADAVVPVERVEDHGDHVDVSDAATLGQHVRPRGGDVRAGDVVVAPGTRLGAVQIGALAAAGVATVVCSSRPRVAILATGSELRNPGESLEPGQIYESNRRMIAAALASSGAEVDVLACRRGRLRVASRRNRARARAGRARHVGRRLDGAARPRPAGRCRARRRGGLLGGRGQAREAALVRRPRRHARLRASGEPGLVARRCSRLRASGASRAAGCRESEAELPPCARHVGASAQSAPRRVRSRDAHRSR